MLNIENKNITSNVTVLTHPCSSQLSKLEDMNNALWDDEGLGASLSALRTSIEEGIETYGIVNITTLTDVFAEDWR